MAEITTGVRSVLSSPAVYELFQNLMGAKRARRNMVERYIRPFNGMRVLDFGCGTAEILNFIPQQIDYVGYDISQDYIDRAQAMYSDRGSFHCRLLLQEEAKTLAPFDFIMAIGVLHHMNDDEARTFLEIGKSALKPGGRFFTLDPCFVDGQHPVAKFLISKDRGQNVRNAEGYETLSADLFGKVKGNVSHQDWIPYTHYAMEMSL